MLKNSEEEKRFQHGFGVYQCQNIWSLKPKKEMLEHYEVHLRKINSPIIRDRDEYKLKNKDAIMRYETGLEEYRNLNRSRAYNDIVSAYDKIFIFLQTAQTSNNYEKAEIRRTEYCGKEIEFFDDEGLRQIRNNIDEDYMVRNKKSLPHMIIKRDRHSNKFAEDTLDMYEGMEMSNPNEHVCSTSWQTETDNVSYDWKVDSSMTDLPKISQIKEVIFEAIREKYTGWFVDQYTKNNSIHWKEKEDVNIIFNEFFKNNYKSFQDCGQISLRGWKRVTYKQDGKDRVICPCRTLHTIMNDGLIDLKRVVEEMINESTSTYNNELQKCYRVFNTRDVFNTMCSNFVTAGRQSTDAVLEYSRPTCYNELLTWIVEPMREDMFKLLKESKQIVQAYSNRYNRKLFEDESLDTQDIRVTIGDNIDGDRSHKDGDICIDIVGSSNIINNDKLYDDIDNGIVISTAITSVITEIVKDAAINVITENVVNITNNNVSIMITDVVTDVITESVTVTIDVTEQVTDGVTDIAVNVPDTDSCKTIKDSIKKAIRKQFVQDSTSIGIKLQSMMNKREYSMVKDMIYTKIDSIDNVDVETCIDIIDVETYVKGITVSRPCINIDTCYNSMVDNVDLHVNRHTIAPDVQPSFNVMDINNREIVDDVMIVNEINELCDNIKEDIISIDNKIIDTNISIILNDVAINNSNIIPISHPNIKPLNELHKCPTIEWNKTTISNINYRNVNYNNICVYKYDMYNINEIHIDAYKLYLDKCINHDCDVLIKYTYGTSHSIYIDNIELLLYYGHDDQMLDNMRSMLVQNYGNIHNNKFHDHRRLDLIDIYIRRIKTICINESYMYNNSGYYNYIHDNGYITNKYSTEANTQSNSEVSYNVECKDEMITTEDTNDNDVIWIHQQNQQHKCSISSTNNSEYIVPDQVDPIINTNDSDAKYNKSVESNVDTTICDGCRGISNTDLITSLLDGTKISRYDQYERVMELYNEDVFVYSCMNDGDYIRVDDHVINNASLSNADDQVINGVSYSTVGRGSNTSDNDYVTNDVMFSSSDVSTENKSIEGLYMTDSDISGQASNTYDLEDDNTKDSTLMGTVDINVNGSSVATSNIIGTREYINACNDIPSNRSNSLKNFTRRQKRKNRRRDAHEDIRKFQEYEVKLNQEMADRYNRYDEYTIEPVASNEGLWLSKNGKEDIHSDISDISD